MTRRRCQIAALSCALALVVALACGVGLVLLSWTSLLDLGEALLGAVAWATVYVSTIGAKQALDKMA